MEYMDKKEVALKVAAKHHDSLAKAVLEYIELTGQADDDLKQHIDKACKECEDFLSGYEGDGCEYMKQEDGCFIPDRVKYCSSFCAAKEEMLSLLPGYLHPTEDMLAESRIFFGEQATDMDIKFPDWMNDRDFLKLPSELSEKIWEYVRDAEFLKWNLTNRYKPIIDKFIAAREAYKKINDDDKSHERNTRVVQALGLSGGQGKAPSLEHRQAYIRYVRLVRNEGKSREEALKRVQQEFPYSSPDSARKSLYSELRKVKDWWRNRNDLDYALYELHEELGKLDELYQPGKKRAAILENYWKSLIPSKKP